MNVLQNIENKVSRDGDGCLTSQPNDVLPKQSMPSSEVENPEINITDGVNPGESDNADATDYPSGSSSSFDDTFSAADGVSTLSDDEIISEFCGSSHQLSWAYPGYEEAFRMRKKKLTSHWRNFIRPIIWRCKWAELQMMKFQSQASMYSRILSEYDRGRQSQLENFSAKALCSRSLPFPHQMKRKKIMWRKKRKRVEDTTDIASYMLQHNLFAYCDNKGTFSDNPHLINGYANPAFPTPLTMPVIPDGTDETAKKKLIVDYDDDVTSYESQFVAYRTWLDEDARAASILAASMEERLSADIINFDHAHQMWTFFRNRYEPTGQSTYIAALRQEQLLRQGEAIVEEFFDQMSEVWRQLDSIGPPLSPST